MPEAYVRMYVFDLYPWLMHMRKLKVHHGNREREDFFLKHERLQTCESGVCNLQLAS